jgi:proliferating cell nuclear antigen PCNA
MFTFENTKTPSKAPGPFQVVLDHTIAPQPLGMPATDYKCSVQMRSSLFQKIIQNMFHFFEHCRISCTPEGIRFTAFRAHVIYPGCIQKMSYLVRSAPGRDTVTILCDEPVEQSFGLRWLNSFTKATLLSPVIYINMSPDILLRIDYPLGGMNELDPGFMQFNLAARCDEADE